MNFEEFIRENLLFVFPSAPYYEVNIINGELVVGDIIDSNHWEFDSTPYYSCEVCNQSFADGEHTDLCILEHMKDHFDKLT